MSVNQKIFLHFPVTEIGGVVLDGLIREDYTGKVNISEHPVGEGITITDTTYTTPDEISGSGLISTTGGFLPNAGKIQEVQIAFTLIKNLLVPITVITHANIYLLYLVTSFKVGIDYPDILGKVDFTAKKIQIAQTKTDTLYKDTRYKGVNNGGLQNTTSRSRKQVKAINKLSTSRTNRVVV